MNKKIYWCKENGTVYWLEGADVFFAPMSGDDTAQLGDGGLVETWDDCVIGEAAVRAALV